MVFNLYQLLFDTNMSSSRKFSYNADMLRQTKKPSSELEIEQLVINDMRQKIVNDEMNDLKFYEIQNLEQNLPTFRSKHMFTDMSLARGTKFHKKVSRSELESRLRKKIAEEPGNLLLLYEIYEQLEENREEKVYLKLKRKEGESIKLIDQYQPENDEMLVTNLDHWVKKVRVKKEKEDEGKLSVNPSKLEQKKKQLQNTNRRSINPPSRVRQSMAQIAMLARQSINAFSGEKSPAMIDKSPRLDNSGQKRESITAFPKLLQTQSDVPLESPQKHSLFKNKMMGSLKKLTIRKKEELFEDRDVNKQVEKYIHQGANLTFQDFKKLDQVKASNSEFIQDFSSEGLIRSLHTLIKMQLTSFTNIHDQSQFYEKQSNQIFLTVKDKINRTEIEIKQKKKTFDILMLENHEIHDRQRQITDLLQQLEEELKTVQSNGKDTQKKSISMKNSSVDLYMNLVNKQYDIENDIKALKESNMGFQRKLIFNNQTIERLENEIVRLQKENKQIKKSLCLFLQELLHLGQDCRNEGLVWIIRKIWEMDEKVLDGHFPLFLDTKAKEFLLKKTKRLIDLDQMRKESHEHFNRYKQQQSIFNDKSMLSMQSIQQNSMMSTLNNSFQAINSTQIKFNILKDNLDKYRDENQQLLEGLTSDEKRYIARTLNEVYSSKSTLNHIVYQEAQKMVASQARNKEDQDSIVDIESQEMKEQVIKEYTEIQRKIEEKEKNIKKADELEANRIIKEIDFKNYLSRFNVEAVQLMGALFGYSRGERELIKNGMLKK